MAKPLTEQQFQTLVGSPESPNTPAQAASLLLAAHGGDDTAAETVLWTTWSLVAGGDPSNRKDADTAEARFLVKMIEAIVDGAEEPKVAAKSERRRAAESWRGRSSSAYHRVAA